MKIIFIHHSCFVVELDEKVLIFDYFDGERVAGYHFGGKLPEYEKETPVYLFASHSHQDHYDMDVLRLAEKYPNIRYIFSNDIRVSPNFLKKHGIDPEIRKRILFVSRGNTYELDGMKIETLKSTDAGVAYYVDVDGICLYHAGDLNDWSMEGAGDLINGQMRRNYQKEIAKLKDRPIHAAFVPLDPRMKENRFLGIEYFLHNTDAGKVFPMHMWQDYSSIDEYLKRITNAYMADRVVRITGENQVFEIDEKGRLL